MPAPVPTEIVSVEPFVLHVPVTGSMIADSTHRVTHWGVVGTRIVTADGRIGTGFTGTHGHLPSDRLITACIRDCYAPLLIGEDACAVSRLWLKLLREPPLQWVGRAGITHIALAAVDIALWDLAAQRSGVPLWAHLGGATSKTVRAYNTDVGWLSIPKDRLVEGCRRAIEADGFSGVKIKVGHADPGVDLDRLEAVRRALPKGATLAIDGNGRWDLPTCKRFCRAAEAFDVYWFEEPLWYDDVASHAELARGTAIPVALGEQLYTLDAFEGFLAAGAVHYVQPDVTRLAGITEYIQVADRALARRLPVVAHVGDMGQVHVHLSFWHEASRELEWIPWIRDCFEEPIAVRDGLYVRPERPGAGTAIRTRAYARFGQAIG